MSEKKDLIKDAFDEVYNCETSFFKKHFPIFFKKEVKYYPTNTDALNNIGVYYQAKGDLDSAIKYFNKCIVINRKYYAVYERLFNLYMQTHQVEKALNTKTIMDNIIKENDLKMQ